MQTGSRMVTVHWLALVMVWCSGCTIFQDNISRCVTGPAMLNVQAGVGPSNGNLMIDLKAGGRYEAIAPGAIQPCHPPPPQVPDSRALQSLPCPSCQNP